MFKNVKIEPRKDAQLAAYINTKLTTKLYLWNKNPGKVAFTATTKLPIVFPQPDKTFSFPLHKTVYLQWDGKLMLPIARINSTCNMAKMGLSLNKNVVKGGIKLVKDIRAKAKKGKVKTTTPTKVKTAKTKTTKTTKSKTKTPTKKANNKEKKAKKNAKL